MEQKTNAFATSAVVPFFRPANTQDAGSVLDHARLIAKRLRAVADGIESGIFPPPLHAILVTDVPTQDGICTMSIAPETDWLTVADTLAMAAIAAADGVLSDGPRAV